jgi:hypothetical protein
VYQDKAGTIQHANPVVADQYGRFPAIFLDGLYKAELKNAAGITETGWPIDNVGQDEQIVPFGIYQETVTYQENEMVTASTGDWYRSKINTNLGNEPTTSPTEWELIIIPLAANFTSDEAWATWSDVGGQISLNINVATMITALIAGGLVPSSSFGQSKTANGYQILPGGLIINWGSTTTSSGGDTQQSWPLAFTSQRLQFIPTAPYDTGSITPYIAVENTSYMRVSTYNTAGARTTSSINWIAIGY